MKCWKNTVFIRKNESVKPQKDVADDYLLKTPIRQKRHLFIVEVAQ